MAHGAGPQDRTEKETLVRSALTGLAIKEHLMRMDVLIKGDVHALPHTVRRRIPALWLGGHG